ncbi:fatty acid desaturase [Alicyclobacillus sp. SO9]|uniref:fatty acid desaturase n=1 Tax=Alicyclobacillus sp. SO9 TaxID=2665646 RepID=UPI0018E7EE1F|nr:fatty acid desaturase [Alicyclobacillus sp. SO9]QQE81157.1 fatty acid desaturase [Alicyclobacillus sp. SO9]
MSIQGNLNNWKRQIAPFEQCHRGKSLWQLATTIIPFFLLWYLAFESLAVSTVLALLLTIPTAGFAVRTFIIFHDCCHGAFFKTRRANAVVGILTGLVVMFPFYRWKREHSIHHATSGNLTRKGVGDIWTLTVDEYAAASPRRRLAYRLYRNPLILFGLGPFYMLLVNYRFNKRNAGVKERVNTYATNAVLLLIIAILGSVLGWNRFLIVEGPVLYLSGMLGIWLFYVQHQFETTYFEQEDNWSFFQAAMHGSSFYDLPKVLNWITGNIGYHHIHHLSSRIPNYNLQDLYRSDTAFQQVPRVGIRLSFRALGYRLWDEKKKQFINFKNVNKLLKE